MIRDFRPADAARVVELARVDDETHVWTPRSLLHRLEMAPPQAHRRWWVAEHDGTVVGFGAGELPWESAGSGFGNVRATVDRRCRALGLRSALYDAALGHVAAHGAQKVAAWARPGDDAAFFAQRGHVRTRTAQKLALHTANVDVSDLPELTRAKEAEGFRVVALREVLDRPRALHELDAASSLDEPGDYALDTMGYEEWLQTFDHPDLDTDVSTVVLAGERPVAWALVATDEERRAVNDFTSTHPEFRQRGLALLAKLEAARRARDGGVQVIYTGNDETNAPMLAINARLGYRPVQEIVSLVREL